MIRILLPFFFDIIISKNTFLITYLSIPIYMIQLLLALAVAINNPIIPGFHPDPSICAVDSDYYLVNSSFQYFPGVSIFHSRDLAHWEQIGNVLNRESQLKLKGATSWTGIYAPTIRYNNGTYYMITTNIGNGGNFIVTAKNPRGPWSEPIWLKQQGIDPSLYFENGKCYMVSNPNDHITLCEINPNTGEQLTLSQSIWQGTGGRYPEGPHIYKKDGYYYLLISEGGTEYGHSLTIARSKNIYGPYEGNPNNPILCNQRRITQSCQIQGTGHGDFVQSPDGKWWVVFLAFRTYGGNYHHLGRETFLAPVEWKTGEWPIVNKNGTITSSDFIKSSSGKDTTSIFIQNPDSTKYKQLKNGWRLYAGKSSLTENNRPTFVGERQTDANMSIFYSVSLHNSKSGDEAGLTAYQINDGHYDIAVINNNGKKAIKYRLQIKSVVKEGIVENIKIANARDIKLRLRSDNSKYYLEYSVNGTDFITAASAENALLSSEVVGGFTGIIIGRYCTSPSGDKCYADFIE
jgi:alpha-N-arabinofuranosidase